jgi:FtsX-like permease family
MTMPQPRTETYEQASYDNIQKSVLDKVNSFIDAMGFHALQAKAPVLGEMQKYNLAILFFNLIFRIVIMIFIVISILLIYSLLMIGIETKTMETGIMRMVGISKRGLVYMIFVQSFMFVIPALILGIALSFPALAVCFIYVFTEKLQGSFVPVPSWDALLFAISVGILIPIFSSIIPVLKVLGQNLNDAINYQRSRVKATYVEIMKKNNVNTVPYLIFGLITSLYGFGIYYLLPLALLSFKLGLILQVFFLILIGYLFGLILFAINA